VRPGGALRFGKMQTRTTRRTMRGSASRRSSKRMRPFFAYHMPNFTFPDTSPDHLFDRVVELALAAEAAGFDLVTVMDHFYQIGGVGPEDEPMLEAYSTLGALAARTTRVKLGAMVTGVTYRNPALVAKMVTTLDVISNGRAVLGLGAAWNDSEHRGYGFEFPPISERLDRLDEALTICRLMFTEAEPSFQGRYYRIDRALNSPRPLQPGGPQIVVGGAGERRTLRIAARHADITNWFGSLEELRHKAAVFEQHCQEVGRDPASVLRTAMVPFVLVERDGERPAFIDRLPEERRRAVIVATPVQAAERLQDYLDAGFHGFVFRNQTVRTPEALTLAGEVVRLMA
jgi:F420-dependent oxidoreductase-like protein